MSTLLTETSSSLNNTIQYNSDKSLIMKINGKYLKYNFYDNDVFSLHKNQKIKGMFYGILKLRKKHIKGIIECADLLAVAYPIPMNLRERLENRILPRFYEIHDVINTDTTLPDKLGLEISNLDKEDLEYGLDSVSICKLLKDKGYSPKKLKDSLQYIDFNKEI